MAFEGQKLPFFWFGRRFFRSQIAGAQKAKVAKQ